MFPASPSPTARIGFCITCKGRTQHLKLTLQANIENNLSYRNCFFLLLNYSSQDDLLEFIQEKFMEEIMTGRLILYTLPDADKFKMAHAKNMAHRLAIREGADILVNLDADNFTGPHFAQYISDKFTEPDIFLWARMIHDEGEKLGRGCSGRIVCTANAFLKLGGYDEKFNSWGPDDKDFNTRLRRIGYKSREIDRLFLDVVPHNDKMRFREYPEARKVGASQFDQIAEASNIIANWGSCGLGTVTRNFSTCPIALTQLPTRIFGIGLHKTATSSLHHALKILGFSSGHWEDAHWAKAIWEEVSEEKSSPTLEKFYCLSDLPIPLLYKKLDKLYPGSKFILTLRDEEDWIESVRKHWSHENNKFRESWASDPFTHKVHKLLYGQKGFDRDKFISRYRLHNAEVVDYFKGRDSLLIMDMTKGAGWRELCPFLAKPVPPIPYPLAYRSLPCARLSPEGDLSHEK